MANSINWGKIYESTYWGSGVSDNTINWGKSYRDLAGDTFTGLLDVYTDAAAAYSLRKLRSDYSGSVVRVRRESDNQEQDIPFANNEIDTTVLESFASSTNAFVTTWYDQSGNGNDVLQTNASNQPKIVENGNTLTEGTKPCIDYAGNKELELNPASVTSNDYSFFGVVNTTSSTRRALFRNRDLGSFGTIEGAAFLELDSNDNITSTFMDDGQNNAIAASSGSIADGYHLISTHYTLSSAALYVDTLQEGSSSINRGSIPLNGTIDLAYINIGGVRFNRPWENTVQEIVLYDNNKLSSRVGIETNINNFYSIY